MFRRTITALVAVLTVVVQAGPHTAAAAANERCFPQTGYCIIGTIRSYWEKNGGLPVFGYPVTALHAETIEGTWTGPTQWFERDRLEDHSNESKGVLAGRLGAQYLELQDRPLDSFPTVNENDSPTRCSYYPQTHHTMCAPFENYWAENGGLARFGYPITEPIAQQIEGKTYTVQYFERRRMEWHPEHAGTPYEVQLGLLGRDVYGAASQPSQVKTYTSPDGGWSVEYPTFLHPEERGDGTVIFIGRDRSVFAAIDSYIDQRNMYGDTGEQLRARARETLQRIYNAPIHDEVVITQSLGSWQTGMHFTSANGADGAAFYEQHGYARGNYRVNGFLYAYPSSALHLAPQIMAIEKSFTRH